MLDNFFKITEQGSNFKTEIVAGITTFLAMVYILGINPTMLAEGGMPETGVFFATAISSGIACIIMGLLSNYPVGLAPGMGFNALFTYTIILEMGNSWETALAAVFLSSIIFLLISISSLRERILNVIPADLKLAIGAGIGFFLVFLGLKGAGIIVGNSSTLIGMGNLASPHTLLALIGIFITLILYVHKVPAAVFIGLLATSVIGVIFTSLGFGVGDMLMPSIPKQFFSTSFDVSLFGGFIRGFNHLFTNIPNLIIMVFSLVFIAFFDATGTLVSLGRQCGFIDENGQVVEIEKAFLSDAIGGMIGSICGTSTVSAYIESAAGIGLGGKTGLTAVVTGILFLLSIFFAPIILALFTSSVTAAALMVVGVLMMGQLQGVNWQSMAVVSSVVMTIMMMILAHSISLGIAWGFLTFFAAKLATGKFKEMSRSFLVLAIVFVIYLFFGL